MDSGMTKFNLISTDHYCKIVDYEAEGTKRWSSALSVQDKKSESATPS